MDENDQKHDCMHCISSIFINNFERSGCLDCAKVVPDEHITQRGVMLIMLAHS